MQKKFDIFLSHSSKDNDFSRMLFYHLERAGLNIWYDESSLIGNAALTSDLPTFINESKALLVVLSKNSNKSGWVKDEYNYAKNLLYKGELTIIPVVIDECELPGFYANYKWIDCRNGLTLDSFFNILSTFYGTEDKIQGMTDIYVSYSWRNEDQNIVQSVFKRLRRKQYRIVGDAYDHTSYDNDNRIVKIMETCGGFIAIVPYREKTNTSRYILDEIKKAEECKLPGLLFADSRVEDLEDLTNYPIIRIDPSLSDTEDTIKEGLSHLYPKKPKTPHIFYATELDKSRKDLNRMIRNIAGITVSLPCLLGEEVNNGNLQQQIVDRIQQSYVMIADISNHNGRYNTCIEAGIARGANRELYLVAQGERHSSPFMFRDMNVRYYTDDIELLSSIHKILRPYRRKIL